MEKVIGADGRLYPLYGAMAQVVKPPPACGAPKRCVRCRAMVAQAAVQDAHEALAQHA